MIDIYCPDIDSDYCVLAIYDPQLLDHESGTKADEPSDQPKTRSINNNPLSREYGNPDRAKLYSRSIRNGLGDF